MAIDDAFHAKYHKISEFNR